MEYPLESWKTLCPFCGDIFFCDNIIPDVPPYVEEPTTLDFTCGHTISTDFVGDVKFCPICSSNLDPIPGLKLKDWQDSQIAGYKL
jgi:hypothetical protein